MSYSFEELRGLSREQLIAKHDHLAEHTQAGISFYLEELARRDLTDHNRAMTKLTWAIVGMTLVMVIATVVNVVLFALTS